MKNTKIFSHRIVSPDGKAIAQAQSIVSASGEEQAKISQSVKVKISSDGTSSSSSSSLSSYSGLRVGEVQVNCRGGFCHDSCRLATNHLLNPPLLSR